MKTYDLLRDVSAKKHPTLLVDLDGTLALMKDRGPFEWARVGEDEPHLPVVFAVKHLALFATIVVVSGCDETCRWQSEMWLKAQGILFHRLFMRPANDFRPDVEVKREIYERDIKDFYPNILGCFDDRPSVIRMWESLGLFVFNCNNGRGEF